MSAKYTEPIEFYLELKYETSEAYLFSDGIDKFWIPKTQIMELEHVKENDYQVTLPEWVAKSKEMI